MNSRQIQYAILLSQIKNFSQVAEKLNISQPALSKQILSLEQELGVKLFDRNTQPLTLTPAGEHFIREAKSLLYKEEQLLRSMERFRSGQAGQLTIGITPFRSSYLISNMVRKVREKFPDTIIKLHEVGSDILRKEAAEGKYDFAIVNLPVDDSILEITPLESDRLVLVVPNTIFMTISKEIDFKECADFPFVVVGETQEMRHLFDNLCVTAGFIPKIAAEVVSLTTAWAMARAGIGATILPWQFVEQQPADDKLTIVELKDVIYTRQPVIVTRHNQYKTDTTTYAIALLTNNSK